MADEKTGKTAVCTCDACSKKLEFDVANEGTIVRCPHCGMETLLYVAAAPDVTTAAWERTPLIITTGNDVCGQTIEKYLGIVRGIVVRGASSTGQILGTIQQNWTGGNIESYARICDESRRDAFEKMKSKAKAMQADAVIAVRFDTAEFGTNGAIEVLAYGTAVRFAKPALRGEPIQ